MEVKIIFAATQHTCCCGILSLGRGFALSDLAAVLFVTELHTHDGETSAVTQLIPFCC